MKATKEDATELVSKYFELVLKEYKAKGVNYFRGDFEAYELIAKGYSMLDVLGRKALSKNQREQLISIIKEL